MWQIQVMPRCCKGFEPDFKGHCSRGADPLQPLAVKLHPCKKWKHLHSDENFLARSETQQPCGESDAVTQLVRRWRTNKQLLYETNDCTWSVSFYFSLSFFQKQTSSNTRIQYMSFFYTYKQMFCVFYTKFLLQAQHNLFWRHNEALVSTLVD